LNLSQTPNDRHVNPVIGAFLVSQLLQENPDSTKGEQSKAKLNLMKSKIKLILFYLLIISVNCVWVKIQKNNDTHFQVSSLSLSALQGILMEPLIRTT